MAGIPFRIPFFTNEQVLRSSTKTELKSRALAEHLALIIPIRNSKLLNSCDIFSDFLLPNRVMHIRKLGFRDSLPTMLYLIGLGLADEKDITVKGLEVVRKAQRVYLEAYTSILLVDHEKLVRFFPHYILYPRHVILTRATQ